MIDSKIIKTNKIYIPNVSRETLKELGEYSQSILSTNKKINLISSTTEKSINTRHIYDSAQTIEFIDKNDIKVCTDLGSGAGLPRTCGAQSRSDILHTRSGPPDKALAMPAHCP